MKVGYGGEDIEHFRRMASASEDYHEVSGVD